MRFLERRLLAAGAADEAGTERHSGTWWGHAGRVSLAGAVLAAAVAGAAAQAAGGAGDSSPKGQATVTGPADAQVEANVLRALAGAPALANEAITTKTVYGVVTLSGSVGSEALRSQAETLAANADGVKRVIDELQLGSATSAAGNGATAGAAEAQSTVQDGGPRPLVLQSDGSYAPAPPEDGTGSTQGGSAPQQPGGAALPLPGASGADSPERRPMGQPGYSPNSNGAPAYGNSAPPYGNTAPPYGSGAPAYGSPGVPSYGAPGAQPYGYPRASGPGTGGYNAAPQAVWGGQVGGEAVVVPPGTMIRVRLNRTLSSEQTPAGTVFDAQVVNDVVAGGQIAIPRGATAEGKVVDAKRSGVLGGRGELSVELTSVTLGGKVYPLVSDKWEHHGGDKTTETVNKAAGLGVIGAVVGALAAGGPGAAIGGGVGAAAGVGSSAASGHGQVFIPAEGVVTFHLQQEAAVTTVSEAEMARLAQGIAPGADGRYLRPRPNQRVYLPPPYPYGYPGPYGYPPNRPYGYPQ